VSPGYPLLLDLTGRRAVVVGGGPVAARRARSLVEAGARVEVVAPAACEDVWALHDAGSVRLVPREYSYGDLAGVWLVHTATGDPEVDARVAEDAASAHIWCVRADQAELSTAWTPAVARQDDVIVAVSGGGDPKRARAIRDAIGTLLAVGDLPVRRHRTDASEPGRVALVGGGPGDPELVTARGRRLVAEADVVVVDRLAPRALLETLSPEVEVVDAGKSPRAHAMTQDEINALIIERAQAGKRVVRLKGGDPFVLGRGGEEALACLEAGVSVEVVPGVTSAIAVPGAAGIPVTHRGISRQFTVVSGHDGAHDDPIDWAALAATEGTLVVLMGVARLPELVAALIAHGRPNSTPVAIVERGTLPDQRVTVAELATVVEQAAQRGVTSPAVVVVGDVVALAEKLGARDEA
jgi:uroporphyrin-III C-methyltransferase/precorrin-2 dehydrogenase/sirohydrochlorin ferrochelatase